MECLIDYIGLRGCSDSEPESELYINSLPQISLESLEKMADAEQQTYLGAWEDIQIRASKRFQIDLINELAKRFRLKQLSQSIDLLKVIDTTSNQTTADNAWYGGRIRLSFPSQMNFVGSSFHIYYFQELRFYSKAVQSGIAFKIFDIQTGEVMFTKTQDLVVGWNRIAVNKRFVAYRLFMAVDATAITELVSQDISVDAVNAFGCACNLYQGRCTAEIHGAKTSSLLTNVTDEDLEAGENLFGLSAIFSVQCNYQGFVCNNKDVFALAWWYLCGKETMVEKLNSSRRNFFTMMSPEKAKENRDDLSNSYKNALKTACDGIDLNLTDCCIECNQAVTIVESRM